MFDTDSQVESGTTVESGKDLTLAQKSVVVLTRAPMTPDRLVLGHRCRGGGVAGGGQAGQAPHARRPAPRTRSRSGAPPGPARPHDATRARPRPAGCPTAGQPVPVSTYRVQLGADLTLRRRRRAGAVPGVARRHARLPLPDPARRARARRTGTTSSTTTRSRPSSAACPPCEHLADGGARRRARARARHRAQPHGGADARSGTTARCGRCWREGPDSPYADWFDVDWSAGDGARADARARRPDRRGPRPRRAGRSTRSTSPATGLRTVLRYHDHVFPVRPGTESLSLAELVERQHYRLAYWRVADEELNYRRFFDVGTLLAVRVEDPDVFDATHRLVLRLLADGVDRRPADRPPGRPGRPGGLPGAAARGVRRCVGGRREDPGGRRDAAARLGDRRDDRLRGAVADPADVRRPGRRGGARRGHAPAHRRHLRRVPRHRRAAPSGRSSTGRCTPRCTASPRWRRASATTTCACATTRGARSRTAWSSCSSRSTATAPTSCPASPCTPSRSRCCTPRRTLARRRLPPERADDHGRRGRPAARPRGGQRRADPRRAARRADRALPADLRRRHGQGRRGHRVLPLDPPRRPVRGGRRARAVRR